MATSGGGGDRAICPGVEKFLNYPAEPSPAGSVQRGHPSARWALTSTPRSSRRRSRPSTASSLSLVVRARARKISWIGTLLRECRADDAQAARRIAERLDQEAKMASPLIAGQGGDRSRPGPAHDAPHH